MMILMVNQPTSTAFYMKNNFWTKISKNGHCVVSKKNLSVNKLFYELKKSNFLNELLLELVVVQGFQAFE